MFIKIKPNIKFYSDKIYVSSIYNFYTLDKLSSQKQLIPQNGTFFTTTDSSLIFCVYEDLIHVLNSDTQIKGFEIDRNENSYDILCELKIRRLLEKNNYTFEGF